MFVVVRVKMEGSVPASLMDKQDSTCTSPEGDFSYKMEEI